MKEIAFHVASNLTRRIFNLLVASTTSDKLIATLEAVSLQLATTLPR
jgi:hypothetical protein